MAIYFIRHGQSQFNAVFTPGDDDPIILDAPLTDLGRRQAIEAREKVRELGIRSVITSPLTRALQTAQLMFEGMVPIEVMDGHRELLLHSCDVGRSPEQLSREFPELKFDHLKDTWWHHDGTNIVSREPEDAFKARIARFVRSLDTIPERPLAVIGHGNAFHEILGHKLANCEVHQYA